MPQAIILCISTERSADREKLFIRWSLRTSEGGNLKTGVWRVRRTQLKLTCLSLMEGGEVTGLPPLSSEILPHSYLSPSGRVSSHIQRSQAFVKTRLEFALAGDTV